jgi:predicted TIM-barrel fold metal-dependent hydrolase
VTRARFPAVDVHLHTFNRRVSPQEKLAAMDATNVRYVVNPVGDVWPGADLTPALELCRELGERVLHFSGFDFSRLDDPDWPDYVAAKLEADIALGARGIKVYKRLGLNITDARGEIVLPDDARLTPIWREAAKHDMLVLYHIADPRSFFLPVKGTVAQLRPYAEHGAGWKWALPWHPDYETLMACMERLAAANRDTKFLFPHMASQSGDLSRLAEFLDRQPNVWVDTAARLMWLGCQPARSRELFVTYADRILWGTDQAWPNRNDAYYDWFRFLETDDDAFHAGSRAGGEKDPLYGIALPDDVLAKVYGQNAARLIGLDLEAPVTA